MPDRASDRFILGLLAVSLLGFSFTVGYKELWPLFVGFGFVSALLQAWLYHRDCVSLTMILALAAGIRLALFPTEPILSDDMFRYLWDGILYTDGINPYAYVPAAAELSQYQQGPLYSLLNSPDFYSIYPPVSQFVFALGGQAARSDWLHGYYIVKAAIVISEYGGLILLSRVLERRQTFLIALHPVILIASAAQGHTDGLLVLFVGFAYWAWIRHRPVLAIVGITLAGWVKLIPLLFLPFFLRKRPGRGAAAVLLTTVLLALPLYAPYVAGNVRESLDLYVRYFEFYAGPYYAVKQVFYALTGDDWSKQLGPAFRIIFLASAVILYYLHYKWHLRAWTSALLLTGAYLLFSTTIHPWYFTTILILVAINGTYSPHWQWASVLSIGTYLLYVDGPYWPFVIVGWGGFFAIALILRRHDWIDAVLIQRARDKVRSVSSWLATVSEDTRVLDLGAGEGHVGHEIKNQTGADVVLADIEPASRRPDLEQIIYDGECLPLPPNNYDLVLLWFVLHHCEHPVQVLSEAVRVSSDRVIIVESTYVTLLERSITTILDRLANRVRGGSRMKRQEQFLNFRRPGEWEALFQESGLLIIDRHDRWRPWHRQTMWLLEKAAAVKTA